MSGVRVLLHDTVEGDRSALGEIPLECVDRVIPMLKHWGVQNHNGDVVDLDTLEGTFQFSPEGSYFEVTFE